MTGARVHVGVAALALLAALVALCVLAGGAHAATLQLVPEADAFTAANNKADENNGGLKKLNAAKNRYAFMRFDTGCAAHPDGYKAPYVQNATLAVYAVVNEAPDELQKLHSVADTPWAEDTVTWNTQPDFTKQLARFYAHAVEGWHTFDVTDAVQTMLDGGQCAVTFALSGKTTAQVSYYAREKASHTPLLTLTMAHDAVEEAAVVAWQDTYVQKNVNVRDTNTGTLKNLISAKNRHVFMQFDMCDIGAVYNATLNIHCWANEGAALHKLHLYKTNAWNETTLTWNTMPDADTKKLAEWVPVVGEWGVLDVMSAMKEGLALTEASGGSCMAVTLRIKGDDVNKAKFYSREKHQLGPYIQLRYTPLSAALAPAAVLGCTDAAAFNYDSAATTDDGSCVPVVEGCTDVAAFNYDSAANTDDGSCVPVVEGCTDVAAFNYDSTANTDDGSCVPVVEGCTDVAAFNYDSTANTDDGSCVPVVEGCTDGEAYNYDSAANTDDGSCVPVVEGCTDGEAYNYDSAANTDDGSCVPVVEGCTDGEAYNYDSAANTDDGSCVAKVWGCTNATAYNYDPLANMHNATACVPVVLGCTDPDAYFTYDPEANTDDGSCAYLGCTDPTAVNYDPQATIEDGSCVPMCPYSCVNGGVCSAETGGVCDCTGTGHVGVDCSVDENAPEFGLELYGHVNYQDGEFKPGEYLVKGWYVRNSGTRAWNKNSNKLKLKQMSGEPISLDIKQTLVTCEPGEVCLVEYEVVMPSAVGSGYSTQWGAYNQTSGQFIVADPLPVFSWDYSVVYTPPQTTGGYGATGTTGWTWTGSTTGNFSYSTGGSGVSYNWTWGNLTGSTGYTTGYTTGFTNTVTYETGFAFELVQDLNYFNDTVTGAPYTLPVSTTFTKSWEVRNIGYLTWDDADVYKLKYKNGLDTFGYRTKIALPDDIMPGETAVINFEHTTPDTPGVYHVTYTAWWQSFLQEVPGEVSVWINVVAA